MKTANFERFDWAHGKLQDCDPNFPTSLHAWDQQGLVLKGMSAFFGFVVDGPAILTSESGAFRLQSGMYFSASGKVTIQGGRGIIMERHGHSAFFTLGGPVEAKGRLKYIDGCTDSLLVSPIKMGDPCLNLLYFPPGIDQTSHTHPSDRIGCVFSGRGECVTPEGVIPLEPGVIFRIPAEGHHKFRTTDSEMRVIAYHPDSDFGPTDQVHPMINRTIVDGVSASNLPQLQTA